MEAMDEVLQAAAEVAPRLIARGETVAVAESSAGGLIAAALLSVAGASAYFRGGAVVYTGEAKLRCLNLSTDALGAHRAATPEHALVLARGARDLLAATWGIGETGAAGPTGNRYGDPAGHTCVGVAGHVERARTIRTESAERASNMAAFAIAALRLLEETLRERA